MPEQLNSSLSIFNGEQIITSSNADAITTTTGLLRIMAKSLTGTSDSPPKFLGYGTGSTTPSETDKGLAAEETASTYSRIPLYNVDSSITSSNTAEITFIFVDETQHQYNNIKELGIFQSIKGNDCVARIVFENAIKKERENSLEVEWKIVLTCVKSNDQEGDDQ